MFNLIMLVGFMAKTAHKPMVGLPGAFIKQRSMLRRCAVAAYDQSDLVLTHWPLGDVAVISNVSFLKLTLKLLSGECHRITLMGNQQWFGLWLGAARQQAITWTNVDRTIRRHMASLGHNELTPEVLMLTHCDPEVPGYLVGHFEYCRLAREIDMRNLTEI